MSLDTAVLEELETAQNGIPRAAASDASVCILKHAVKIWARDQGIAEADLARLSEMVMGFANQAMRDCERRLHVVA